MSILRSLCAYFRGGNETVINFENPSVKSSCVICCEPKSCSNIQTCKRLVRGFPVQKHAKSHLLATSPEPTTVRHSEKMAVCMPCIDITSNPLGDSEISYPPNLYKHLSEYDSSQLPMNCLIDLQNQQQASARCHEQSITAGSVDVKLVDPASYNADDTQRIPCYIPESVFKLFLYLLHEGVAVKDLFRRPGNIAQIKQILHNFSTGYTINWADYNIHTVATVAKRLLSSIPNGLFGAEGEKVLLQTALITAAKQVDPNQVETVIKSRCASTNTPTKHRLNTVTNTEEICDDDDDGDDDDKDDNEGEEEVGQNDDVNHANSLQQCIYHATVIQEAKSTQSQTKLLFNYKNVQQTFTVTNIEIHRLNIFQNLLDDLSPAHKQLAILLFGSLHQLVYSAALNTARALNLKSGPHQQQENQSPNIPLLTLAEGVAKSVAGSLFHSCSNSIVLIDHTAQVLQSLVLCFPLLRTDLITFYWNVLLGQCELQFTKPLTSKYCKLNWSKSGDNLTCNPVCPFLFCHLSSRSGSANLLNAAGRLFCFANNTSNNGNVSEKHSILGKNHAKKSKETRECRVKEHKLLQTVDTSNKISSAHLESINNANPINEKYIEQNPLQSPVSIERLDDSHVCVNNNNRKIPSIVTPASDRPHNLPNNTMLPITLRRHQSRYRSLRRRQMENLARRAEWFLSPTTIPQVTITATNCTLFSQPTIHEDYSQTNSRISTVSLSDIDYYPKLNQNEMQPFYALSTMELDYAYPPSPPPLPSSCTKWQADWNMNSTPITNTNCQNYKSFNQNRLTANESRLSTFADSFTSLHSAPYHYQASSSVNKTPSTGNNKDNVTAVINSTVGTTSGISNKNKHSCSPCYCYHHHHPHDPYLQVYKYPLSQALTTTSVVESLLQERNADHSLYSHNPTSHNKLTALSGPDLLQSVDSVSTHLIDMVLNETEVPSKLVSLDDMGLDKNYLTINSGNLPNSSNSHPQLITSSAFDSNNNSHIIDIGCDGYDKRRRQSALPSLQNPRSST